MAEGHNHGNNGNGNGNGNGQLNRIFLGVVTALTISAIVGGISAWRDASVIAAELATHKEVEQQRLNALSAQLTEMRAEVKLELRELRNAVESRK